MRKTGRRMQSGPAASFGQWAASCRRRAARAKGALPLLLCGLILLCLLGLAGCGRASQLVEPQHPEVRTLPKERKASCAELKAARYGPVIDHGGGRQTIYSLPRNCVPRQRRSYRKAMAVVFGPDDPYTIKALKLLEKWNKPDWPHLLALFDMNEDGTPELMEIYYGVWAGGFHLYDLSGRLPVYLGSHPWPHDGPEVYTRQAENGRAWRLDGYYGHGYQSLTTRELLIPGGDGLHIWECFESIDHCITLPTTPYAWTYWVEHRLLREGHILFDRTEEHLGFVPEDLLADRAARDEEGRPPEEQLKENEYHLVEMEERMETSLYHELLDGWERIPVPWLDENAISPEGDNWTLELPERISRLYKAWEERQAG